MSQRECPGFNWPPLAVSAEDPVSSCPVAVSRAGPCGTVQRSTVLRDESLFPASLLPFCAGVPAIGVGQPASDTCLRISTRRQSGSGSYASPRPSDAFGVAHDPRLACAVSVSATPRPQRIPDDSASSARGVDHDASTA